MSVFNLSTVQRESGDKATSLAADSVRNLPQRVKPRVMEKDTWRPPLASACVYGCMYTHTCQHTPVYTDMYTQRQKKTQRDKQTLFQGKITETVREEVCDMNNGQEKILVSKNTT